MRVSDHLEYSPVLLWAEAEVTTGIVVGCLPILPALFRYYFPGLFAQGTQRPSRSSLKHNRIALPSARQHKGGVQYAISVDDCHLLDAESIELADVKTWNYDAKRGPTIKIEGGTHMIDGHVLKENPKDLDTIVSDTQKAINGQGILRTVRVETETSSIQQPSQAHHAPGTAM